MNDLVLRNIRKQFGPYCAVSDVDLTLPAGKLTALLGPSGCGKTTLLRLIAGLDIPTSGEISLGGADITSKPAHQRKFGMVFQSFALFPHLNVRENIGYSLAIAGRPKTEMQQRAIDLLKLVKLDGYGERRIGQLSGGQRQRVAIARALAQEPALFLLDEPMSALDAQLREDMQVELRLLQQKLGITTIVVTHDQREAMTMADQIVVMSQGRIEQVGSPQDIYHRPSNAFVAGFIGRANFFTGQYSNGEVRFGQTVLTVPKAEFATDTEVTVMCRPETAILESAPGHVNSVPARVVFVRDVGASNDIYLDTPMGEVIVEYSSNTMRRHMAAGDTVHVSFPPESLHLFDAKGREK